MAAQIATEEGMSVIFEIPEDIERLLRAKGLDIAGDAKVSFLVRLYREGKIPQARLSQALDLDRYETDDLLRRHGIEYGQTLQEFHDEVEALRDARAS
ncbi:UPF0175 family protein [Aquisphaera insulae]|uniref:UPF0175 family protein n=1 Tax=Aquisphaera insulae TaxID=2712864 RepID=UPI0013EC664E|nr:UPF0175 family protein [Aquisphaera insulae]